MPQPASRLPAVVFLHGIGGSAQVWVAQLAAFAAAGFAAVALDLLGYGTRPAVAAMDFEALAGDVEGAIARRGLHRPVLIGHSLGGMVVQTSLRRKPDGYSAAILAATSPAFGNPGGDFQQKFVSDRLRPLDGGRRPRRHRRRDRRRSCLDRCPIRIAARVPSRRCRRSTPIPIAPRYAVWLALTSVPTCRPYGCPCSASPVRTIATPPPR